MTEGLPHFESGLSFDPQRRFVRVAQVRPDGFIEFDFSVGVPDLLVELILPAAAFREFCAAQGVEHIPVIDVTVCSDPISRQRQPETPDASRRAENYPYPETFTCQ